MEFWRGNGVFWLHVQMKGCRQQHPEHVLKSEVAAHILCGSIENEGDWQSRSLHKHSRSAFSRPVERGQIDRYWPDHHCTEVTGMQERHLRDDGVVGTLCHFRGQVHHYCEHRHGGNCNLLGIRVPMLCTMVTEEGSQ